MSSMNWLLASFAGFWMACEWDLPVGPTEVVLLGVIFCLAFMAHKIIGWAKAKPPGAGRTSAI